MILNISIYWEISKTWALNGLFLDMPPGVYCDSNPDQTLDKEKQKSEDPKLLEPLLFLSFI
ncbi:MAG: hypothetical protein ABIV51_02690 [Saprospiraceae bacterium]